MNILVIGNGFDLAHNLPTKYSNFLDFVKTVKESNESEYTLFVEKIKNDDIKLYSEIQNLINQNVLLDYFLSIYEERCREGKEGWIDFESEISFIVQKLDEAKQYISSQVKGPNDAVELRRDLFEYLRPIIVTNDKGDDRLKKYVYWPELLDYQAQILLKELNKITRLLEIYLNEYVENINCEYRLQDFEGIVINSVLSFNYTDTYKKYYEDRRKTNYCYIHGESKESDVETCNLVLGIDEYLTPERKDNDNQFVWFKKFYQRIYKGTSSEYLDWIKNLEDYYNSYKDFEIDRNNIFIYGHSLDVTDKDVLSKLLLMENTITHIFYRDRKDLANKINNLVKVIGEDNLIKMTGGTDRTIKFIQSKPAAKIDCK